MDAEIRFKPLTLGVLEKACALTGLDLDEVLDDPQTALAARLSPDDAPRFCQAVLERVPAVEDDELRAQLHQVILARFFTDCLAAELKLYNDVSRALFRRSGVPGGGSGTSIRRTLAEYPPSEYDTIVHHMRLADFLSYLAAAAVNAEHKKR